MDHRLAIVIVPKDTTDPVQASGALLDRYQTVPLDNAPAKFEQKFRYKRVGGWFDGLVNGRVGEERWSTVLRMLLDGTDTNAGPLLAGVYGETGAEIESRMEADNTIDLDDIWPLAPCSVIVTPDGSWLAHPNPDRLEEQSVAQTEEAAAEETAWARLKRATFWEFRGSTIVAWDLSWNFIGAPGLDKRPETLRRPSFRRTFGRRASNTEDWRARVARARRRRGNPTLGQQPRS